MRAIHFPEVTNVIGKGQPEYNELPAALTPVENTNHVEIVFCMEPDAYELDILKRTGQIWVRILQPRNTNFNPISITVDKPVI